MTYQIPKLPLPFELETKPVLEQLERANKQLAELKELAQRIPDESLFINTLSLQESKQNQVDANIVTTQDFLFKSDLGVSSIIEPEPTNEIDYYRKALLLGFQLVRKHNLITNNTISQIQMLLLGNDAGFRKVLGTELKDDDGAGGVVYTPPQYSWDIQDMMSDLEKYTNDASEDTTLDPLIKMAVIHHQFESIHPFLNGNGRTGRIISVLFLVTHDLLEFPILHLNRYVTRNKQVYYQKLQAVRDAHNNEEQWQMQWQEWVLFMLRGVEEISYETNILLKRILILMSEFEKELCALFWPQYHQCLLDALFYHPYITFELIKNAIHVSCINPTTYLDTIVGAGLLNTATNGHSNYYVNSRLVDTIKNLQNKPSEKKNNEENSL